MMRTLILLMAVLIPAVAPVIAQEGHPLTGTWHGSWGPNAAQRTDVTFVLEWDGKNIAGLINPGFDGTKIQNARLDAGWAVHFEGDSKDGRIVIDGKIENVTNVRRAIVGTWTQGSRKGDFKIIRDN